jgi:membrane protease YdiL (CAAX protease family)
VKTIKEANHMQKADTVSPSEAVLVFAVTFVLFLLLGAVFILALGIELGLILSELLILVVPLSYLLVKRVNIRSYVGVEIKPKFILLGIASGVFLFFFDGAVSAVLTSIFGVSQAVEESNALVMNLSNSTLGLVSVTVALSLSGFCEEFTFRGFLQNTINRKYSFVPAVIISSIAFGFAHFDPQLVYILSAFLIGLVLGYIYHRWHSYVVSAFAHSTVNLMALAILLLVR